MKTRRRGKQLLVLRLVMASGGFICQEAFCQEGAGASSTPKAQQVPLSQSTGSVDAQQSTTGSAGSTSSVNTLNSTIQVSGSFAGSIPDPKAPQGSLTLTIADAIHRGLQFNLGGVTANVSVRQARAQRLAALSQMLPNISGTLTEASSKVDRQNPPLQKSSAIPA